MNVKREFFFLLVSLFPEKPQKNPSTNSPKRPCKKHVRFQDENSCDFSLRDAKIRRVDGKSPEEFDHFHVGGTTLCVDYTKRAMLEASRNSTECGRKRCNYSDNYPSSAKAKRSVKFSSIYV
jgi:hypothetical protein